ncbi:MAG: hypothetical protein U0166_06565 [Acidobacteriota bacterium]
MRTPILAALTIAMGLAATVHAADCPKAVTDAIAKAYPGSTVGSCVKDDDDASILTVTVTKSDKKKLEVDAKADGAIVATEEDVDPSTVPAAVLDAFKKKFPNAKVTGASKETETAGGTTYEVLAGRHEAKFKEDGSFVAEEDED